MNGPAYEYRATVKRVVDGDTLDLDIDLGFELRAVTRVRLLGVNAPEVVGANKAAGLAAAAFVSQWVDECDSQVLIRSFKAHQREKYGRWLVEVFAPDGSGSRLNADLVATGHAVPLDDHGSKA